MRLRSLTLDQLHIDDERSYRHVSLYEELKQVVRRSEIRFHVPEPGSRRATWDRIVFLNLTFWSATEAAELLVDDHIAADVVAHVAWHHLARRALSEGSAGALTAEGMLLGESIASAFDLYLVGRLLGHAADAQFLETQVPAMAEVAEAAGLSDGDFEALLEGVAADPDGAFEALRELLFDASTALIGCTDLGRAASVLSELDGHRFAPLLHHYELSNWILYARAYAATDAAASAHARSIDLALRAEAEGGAKVEGGTGRSALDWLETRWIRPLLGQ